MQLEISVFSIDAAIKAYKAGADRIELCSNPTEGGTTPPYGLIKVVTEKTDVQVFPIIRPRGGDFCYSNDEFEMMKEDILFCKETGCSGIATGILLSDNSVDVKRLKELVQLAYPMEISFIRAFDLTPDPVKALHDVMDAGCKRILTSGQALKATDAIALIKKLATLAGDNISVMPGSGIRPENIKEIVEKTGVHEVHSSARLTIPNSNPKVDELGFGNAISCDETQIAEMKKIIDTLSV